MGCLKLSVAVMVFCAVKCSAMSYNELEDFEDYLTKTSQLTPSLKQGTGDFDQPDEDEVISDNAWEESGKFEGDLILNQRQRILILKNVAEQGLARNGIIDGAKRWPNNEVIFAIQVEHFSRDQVQAILNGIDDLARASCVKFRPYRKGDRDAVVIQGNRRGCFSQVGYQGGYQALNLWSRHPVGRGCFRHGTVVHEMLHSLGFYHMQSSPDRDDYVDIIWDNILKSSRHNFRKYNTFTVSDFGVGYDYDSVLHYSRNAFSINGKATIVPKQRGAQIGQRVGLSDKDTRKLNKMYCDGDLGNGPFEDKVADSTEKSKKKSIKNKPFEGHGLGYHKGTAVVFKLLPGAETYKLTDVPSSHILDDVSIRPHILSTAENEDFSAHKEVEYSYKPPITLLTEGYTEPVSYDAVYEMINKEMKPQIQLKVTDIKNVNHTNDKEPKALNNENLHADTLEAHDDEQNPDLTEALNRLTKIIKAHVYPSQTPDLRIYQMNERRIKHGNNGEVGKEKDYFEQLGDRITKGETAKAPVNLYDDLISKIATDGYYVEPEEKKSKELAIAIPDYKDKHEKYVNQFFMEYPRENKYARYSLLNRDEDESHTNDDHDGWHQQFTPFKHISNKDHSDRNLDF